MVTEAPGPPVAGGEPLRLHPRGLAAEFRDAVTMRATVLVVGVALLQLGFIASYIGAFHHPTPHRLPLAVVAPAAIEAKVVAGLNAIDGMPLRAVAVDSTAAGTRKLLDRTVYGVLVVDAHATTDRLLEASASGVSASTAMTLVMDRVEDDVAFGLESRGWAREAMRVRVPEASSTSTRPMRLRSRVLRASIPPMR